MFNSLPFNLYQQLLQDPLNTQLIKSLNKTNMTPICPFEVILGITNTTEAGYKPLNSVPTDYTQFSRTWNGKEASLVNWLNSYTLSQSSTRTDKKINHATKTFQVGDVYWGIFIQDNINSNFVPYSGNSGFTSQQILQQITIRIYNIALNENFFSNLINSQLQFYILPEGLAGNLTPAQKANPYDDIDRNFLLIEEQNIVRNVQNEIIYVDCTFLSFQNKITNTGLTVNSYLQTGGPGEPYAFPALLKNTSTNELEVILDNDRLKGLPITHVQVTLYGNAELTGYGFMGRPVYEDDQPVLTKMEINEPNIIAPKVWQGAISDTLSLRKAPETNYYWKTAAKYALVSSRNIQDNINTSYNPFARRNIQGILQSSYETTITTNQTSSKDPTPVPYWDSRFLDDTNNGWDDCGGALPITGNDWMVYIYNNKVVQPDRPNPKTKGKKGEFLFNEVIQQDFTHFNFFNWVVYKPLYEIPLTLDLTTPIAYGRYPVVGKIWSVFTLGLGRGFARQNDIVPKYSFVNALANVGLYNNYTKALFYENAHNTSGTEGAKWTFNRLIDGIFDSESPTKSVALGDYPMEVLYDAEDDDIGAIIGTNATTTAFCSSLTHKVKSNFFDTTGKYLKDYIVETSMIGQNINNVGFTIINENTILQPKEQPITLGENTKNTIGYYIDLFNMKTNAKCDYQLKFFSYINTKSDDISIDDKHCVYIAKLETQSKGSNTVRVWNSTYKFSNPLYDFAQKFQYPQDLQEVPPKQVPSYTREINFIENWKQESTEINTFTNGQTIRKVYGTRGLNLIPKTLTIDIPAPDEGYKFESLTGNIQILLGANTKKLEGVAQILSQRFYLTYNNKQVITSPTETKANPFTIKATDTTFNHSFNFGTNGTAYEDIQSETTGNNGRFYTKCDYKNNYLIGTVNYDENKNQLNIVFTKIGGNQFQFLTEFAVEAKTIITDNYYEIKSEGTSQYTDIANINIGGKTAKGNLTANYVLK